MRPTPILPLAALVAAGGMLGVASRATLEAAFAPTPGHWPWATFTINITGSLVLGLLLESLLHAGPDHGWRRAVRLGAGTGLIGGFTTYSTFIIEIEQLAGDGHLVLGAAYALVSITLGIAAAVAGTAVAAATWKRHTRARGGDS